MSEERELRAVIDGSFMGSLSEQTRALLLARARLLRLPPGHLLIDGRGNFAGVVVSGLLRVCSDDGDGRSVTYRNVARSEAVGIGALLDQADDIWVQTVTHSRVLSIDLRVVADLRTQDAAFNLALARETLQRLRDTSRELLVRVHGSVRQRVARQLLDLAAEAGSAEPVTVRVSHETLAANLGSRREVVTRVLGELEHQGLIERGRNRVTILRLLALRDVVTLRRRPT